MTFSFLLEESFASNRYSPECSLGLSIILPESKTSNSQEFEENLVAQL